MTHPYRPDPPDPAALPALWAPGVLLVEADRYGEECDLKVGPTVGWHHPRGIEDWKRGIVAVEKSMLTDALKKQLGVRLPEERIPAAKFPEVLRGARACPVVAFAPALKKALLSAGLRVFTIEWHRGASAGMVGVEGPGEPWRGINGTLWDLLVSIEGDPAYDDDDDRAFPKVSRVLHAISDGRIDEDAIALATDLLDTLDDPLGLPPSDEGRDEQLTEWNTWLEAKRAEAETSRAEVNAIVAAVSAAPPADDVITIPIYGFARRVREPSMTILCSEGEVNGEKLVLAPTSVWKVRGVVTKPEPTRPSPATRPERPDSKLGRWFLVGGAALLVAYYLLH